MFCKIVASIAVLDYLNEWNVLQKKLTWQVERVSCADEKSDKKHDDNFEEKVSCVRDCKEDEGTWSWSWAPNFCVKFFTFVVAKVAEEFN